ncbi:MAG: class I SAM-dependent DNA methyltransferase, partial [Deltaproteobacteria bacterium]
HEVWALFFGSTMKDDPVYTPSDCFETFPFPRSWASSPDLTAVGEAYYDFRAALMVQNNEGLTKTYNRFHDPDETTAEIFRLRDLHDAMDRAVLDVYGWPDLRPTCEFLLDYEDEDDADDDSGRARKRKKPWRYRWPDDVRDEVLARLLKENLIELA